MTTSSRSVLPGIATAACSNPMCQSAAGSDSRAGRSRNGLWGARFVGKAGAWTMTSQVGRWITGVSGVTTVIRSSSAVLPPRVLRS